MSINDFIDLHVPLLYETQLTEFGSSVNYWPSGDQAQAVAVALIWVEGTEDEESSPGRYSHAHVKNDTIPAGLPLPGDAIEKDGKVYDIVDVRAYVYKCSTVILQERGLWPR